MNPYNLKVFPKRLKERWDELKTCEITKNESPNYSVVNTLSTSILGVKENSRFIRSLLLIPALLSFLVLSYSFSNDFYKAWKAVEKKYVGHYYFNIKEYGLSYYDKPIDQIHEVDKSRYDALGKDLKLSLQEYLSIRYTHFIRGKARFYTDVFSFFIIFLVTPIFFFWCLLYKRRALVYFDRDKRQVYTWLNGTVYAMPYDQLGVIDNQMGVQILLCGENATGQKQWFRFKFSPSGSPFNNPANSNKIFLAYIVHFMESGLTAVSDQPLNKKQAIYLRHDKQPLELDQKIAAIFDNLAKTHGGIPKDFGAAEYLENAIQKKKDLQNKWYRPRNLFVIFSLMVVSVIGYIGNQYNIKRWLTQLDYPKDFEIIDNGKMVAFKGERCFLLGGKSDWFQPKSNSNQLVRGCVKDFAIGVNEVTVSEYQAFIKATNYRPQPGTYSVEGCPGIDYESSDLDLDWVIPEKQQLRTSDISVSCVSYFDAQAYISWLNETENKNYRLPTEHEWEYAAQGKKFYRYFLMGDYKDPDNCGMENLIDQSLFSDAICPENADGYKYIAPIGQYSPNGYGLHDIFGNVAEWTCSDRVAMLPLYSEENVCSTLNFSSNQKAVTRGGSYFMETFKASTGYKFGATVTKRYTDIGFRLVRDL